MVTKNTLNLQGQADLIFWTGGSNCNSNMTFSSIVRNNNAIMAISPNWGGTSGVLGQNVQLLPPIPRPTRTVA